jgi:SAM-dependent methyltransferase
VSSRPRPPSSGRAAPVRPAGRQRRALSQASAGGRIERGGDPDLAARLAGALLAAQRESEVAESGTHGFHTYPARMHPATARHLIALGARSEGDAAESGAGVRVLDPFCGSGTTLVEARRIGMSAMGSDLNPLAVLIARARTWTVARPRREAAWQLGREVAAGAMAQVKAARRAGYSPPPLHKVGRDPAGRDRAIGEWFAPHVRRELETLASLVDRAAQRDAEVGDVLRAVLSSILYKVSYRASDTDTTKVKRQVARGAAVRLFEGRLALLFEGLDELARVRGPLPRVRCCDARRLGGFAQPASFDLVVTSPPYAGTYDYAEQHRLRMIFLGLDPSDLARGEIGARPRFTGGPERRARALAETAKAFGAALGEIARALVPGGRAAMVVGDSLAGGAAVLAEDLVREALAGVESAARLEVVAWARQERTELGRAEARAFAGTAKREHILLLQRTA